MRTWSKRVATLSVAITLPLAAIMTPANAEVQQPNVPPVTSIIDHPMSNEEVAAAAAELDYLFTTVFREGSEGWSVNKEAADVANISVAEAQQIADALNERNSSSHRPVLRHAVNSKEYARCVLNSVGLGSLTNAALEGGSQLGYLIAAKNWKEVAWVLGRLAGVQALKGGVIGAVATLTAAGGWCATPWAS